MRIYPRSLYGLTVDLRRAAILATSLVTDSIATTLLGQQCGVLGCTDRFHSDMKRKLHEYANHAGDRRRS